MLLVLVGYGSVEVIKYRAEERPETSTCMYVHTHLQPELLLALGRKSWKISKMRFEKFQHQIYCYFLMLVLAAAVLVMIRGGECEEDMVLVFVMRLMRGSQSSVESTNSPS